MSKIRNLTVEEVEMVAGGPDLLTAYLIAIREEMMDSLNDLLAAGETMEPSSIDSISR